MTSINSDNITDANITNVRSQINAKKQYKPFYATIADAKSVVTDFDTFPYPRWFRGVPDSYNPIVAEREAGWRPRYDGCYKPRPVMSRDDRPNICFEGACSLVSLCVPNPHGAEDDLAFSKSCVINYR